MKTNTKTTKVDANISVKTFRHSNEVENLYRFVHENGLRNEASKLLSKAVEVLAPKTKKARRKTAKKKLN